MKKKFICLYASIFICLSNIILANFLQDLWCPKGHFNWNQSLFVQSLAHLVKPRYAIETGFCTGRSAASLLFSSDLELFISIDIDLDYMRPEGRMYAQLLQDQFSQFFIIESSSQQTVGVSFFEKYYSHGIDWATIDGDHSYKGCTFDLESISAYVNQNGIIIIDDYKSGAPDGAFLPSVTKAVDDFCKSHPEFYKTEWNKRGKGFAILTYSAELMQKIKKLL